VRGRLLLVAGVVTAILVTVATTAALLWAEPRTSAAEAVKTGGLAGGAVVALYALWLNDRRRRTDEERQQIETQRHRMESEKVADERFARAVEMLGNDADQVRVGAMHALAGLAQATPRYKQTVLDVLCAYLRRPFEHPAFEHLPEDPDQAFHRRAGSDRAGSDRDGPGRAPTAEEDQERTVRLTAQRLITDLLPWGRDTDERRYHLDLTGANVEYLRLEGRRIGWLTARRTRFHGITAFHEVRFAKPALFSGATFHGRVDFSDGRFAGGISFQDAEFAGELDVRGAVVGRFLHLPPTPPAQVGALGLEKGTRVKADPAGWALVGAEHATFEHRPEPGTTDEDG